MDENKIGSVSQQSSSVQIAFPQTYSEVVGAWKHERESLRQVQPLTAKKAAQKALLFEPWIGNTPINAISSISIKEALVSLGTSGGRSGKGLSSATLRAAHLAGSQAVDWAIGNGYTDTNPFKQVARPKANYRQSKYLTMEQASTMAETMADEVRAFMTYGDALHVAFCLAVCIAIATGMRRGEIFALEWECVDEQMCRINVSKAIKGEGSIGFPKSRSSIRSVAIGKGLAKLLAEVRKWQSYELPTPEWPEPHYVILDNHGKRASMNSFEHWWRKWANDNGWKGLRFHELRHTHATLLIANGADVKTVQMRLGHSSAEITMSCYAHAIPLSDSAYASSLDSSLFR